MTNTIHGIQRPPTPVRTTFTTTLRMPDVDPITGQPTMEDFDCPTCGGPTRWISPGSCYHPRGIYVDRTDDTAAIGQCDIGAHDYDWDNDRNWECSECGHQANDALWQRIDTYFSERA